MFWYLCYAKALFRLYKMIGWSWINVCITRWRKLNEDVGEIFLGFLRIYWRLCKRILLVGEYKMLNKSHVNYNMCNTAPKLWSTLLHDLNLFQDPYCISLLSTNLDSVFRTPCCYTLCNTGTLTHASPQPQLLLKPSTTYPALPQP